ncbi:hypothetical protein E2C01_042849 [Portunus trituberculatus]|uniref:Uncharacterized protein n=1 Tax=Portunus trituberculatus TaxID=210409 RepID=A0A5B7FUQ3_PORTR|nr:hypothetical protein [Portunus trituberculatus]
MVRTTTPTILLLTTVMLLVSLAGEARSAARRRRRRGSISREVRCENPEVAPFSRRGEAPVWIAFIFLTFLIFSEGGGTGSGALGGLEGLEGWRTGEGAAAPCGILEKLKRSYFFSLFLPDTYIPSYMCVVTFTCGIWDKKREHRSLPAFLR